MVWGDYIVQKSKSLKTNINVKIDQDLVDATQSVLDELGLDQTTAIVMFYKRIVAEGGIPFDIKLTERQKAINKLQEAIKDIPVTELTDRKELQAWLDDEPDDN